MTPEELLANFEDAYPKAVYIPETEDESAVTMAGAMNGYRLAGKRLGVYVFTTKQK